MVYVANHAKKDDFSFRLHSKKVLITKDISDKIILVSVIEKHKKVKVFLL